MSKPQWIRERTFCSIKGWFGSGKARYKKLARVHVQHLIDTRGRNLYRSPGWGMRCL
ncbi:MAG: hypothetical protein ACMUEL_06550 [Flavobacteriales bacterium Tduv]